MAAGAFSEAGRLARTVMRHITQPKTVAIKGVSVRLPAGAKGAVKDSLYAELYERHETGALSRLLEPGDVVVEAGAAIGFVGLHASKIIDPSQLHLIEANRDLIAEIEHNFKANGRAAPHIHYGLAAAPGVGETPFRIAQNFWSSSELDRGATVRVDTVPAIDVSALFAEASATVFICDIEGGEFTLLPQLDLSTLRLIILEIHDKLADEGQVDALKAHLDQSGFEANEVIAGEVHIYRRRGAGA